MTDSDNSEREREDAFVDVEEAFEGIETIKHNPECPECGTTFETSIIEITPSTEYEQTFNKRAGVCCDCLTTDSDSINIYIVNPDSVAWFQRDVDTDDLCENLTQDLEGFDFQCDGNGATRTIAVGDVEYAVCETCVDRLEIDFEVVEVEDEWWKRMTDAHRTFAATLFRELDSVECVIDQLDLADFWVHTDYIQTNHIRELASHFGFEIYSASIELTDEYYPQMECMDDHGTTFEIDFSVGGDIIFPLRAPCSYRGILDGRKQLGNFEQ